jgi:signal transduction histidine kinase
VGKTLASVGLSAGRLVAEPADAETLLRGLRERAERRDGVRAMLHDGRTLECDFVPIVVQGVYRGYLSTYRDVTGQARAEAERERLLASEREENRRLAELDAYRSESLAAVSHELRTPLTSIVGYTHLLRASLDATASAEEAAYLDAIARNVDRLLRLAGDVVALDSLETRAMPLPVSAVDVPKVVERAVRTVRPQAADRSIDVTVETEPGPVVRGDEDRLAQLLENLLANAVKFTLSQGRIVVRAVPLVGAHPDAVRSAESSAVPASTSAAGIAAPTWELTVVDNGIGVPEDELSMLSNRFFRASNARRRGLPGSGLGLSVARAIAERHGGSLSVSSIVGVGTSVTVRFGDVVEDVAAGTPPDS